MGWATHFSTAPVKIWNGLRNLQRNGPRATAALYGYRFRERFRDWQLGIDTSGSVEADILALGVDCEGYEPINYRCLDIAFEYLRPWQNQDVFLDYGCGKGRAVVIAATHPFRRVIGLEVSSMLSKLARQNVTNTRAKLKCRSIEIECTDAAEYRVPTDVTTIFLFNPFTGTTLSAVQQHIQRSLDQSPRRLRIVYMHPSSQPDSFSKCDWLEQKAELSTADWNDVTLKVYETS